MKLGIFVKCSHPEMIEALGIARVDFAVVDMEHTPLGPRDLYPLVLAAERRSLDLIVRIPDSAPRWFKWCLDLGVKTIQVPEMHTAGLVRAAVNSAQFSPLGDRGLCRLVRAADFSAMDRADFLTAARFKTQLIFQIESQMALENLDDILRFGRPVLIGPYDLSASLGLPSDIWHPTVVQRITHAIERCQQHKIEVGIFTDTKKGIEYWRAAGVDFIEYGSDLQILMRSVRDLKQWTDHVAT